MNERLRELAKEAGAGKHGAMRFATGYVFSDEELEKFVELIVRECGAFCGHDHEGVVAMFNHFGVSDE